MFRPDHNGWNPLMVAAHQGTKDPWPELLRECLCKSGPVDFA